MVALFVTFQFELCMFVTATDLVLFTGFVDVLPVSISSSSKSFLKCDVLKVSAWFAEHSISFSTVFQPGKLYIIILTKATHNPIKVSHRILGQFGLYWGVLHS